MSESLGSRSPRSAEEGCGDVVSECQETMQTLVPSPFAHQDGEVIPHRSIPWRLLARPAPVTGALPGWASWLGVLAVLVLATLAVKVSPGDSSIAVFYPAAGVGVVMVALSPRRRSAALLAGIVAATSLASVINDRPLPVAVIFGATLGLTTWVVSVVLTRGGSGIPRLRSLEDLFWLMSAAVLGAVVQAAILGPSAAVFLGQPLGSVAFTFFTASVASYLLVLPITLILADRSMRRRTHRPVETLVQLSVLLVVLSISFFPAENLPLAFATVPFLVWAGLRLNLLVCAVETLLVGVLAAVLTAAGAGPFGVLIEAGRADAQTTAQLTQLYYVVLVMVTLPLALSGMARRAAMALAEEGRELYRRALDESVIGMMLMRPDAGGLVVSHLNGPAARLLGKDEDALRGRGWEDRLGPDERFLLREVAAELERGRSGSLTREVELVGEPSTWLRLSLSWRDDGTTGGLVIAQLVDITEMRISRAELARERDFTSAVLNSADALILVLDRDQVVHRVNHSVEQLVKGRSRNVVGQPLWNTGLTGECVSRLHEALAQPGWELQDRHPLGEHEWRTGTASRRVFAWTCSALARGEADLGVVLTGIDVTAQRDTQQLLEQVLASTTGTSIIGTDLDGTVTFINPGAEQMLGYTAGELVGTRTPEIFHDPDELAERAAELGIDPPLAVLGHEVLRSGQPERRDWTHIRKDGQRITVSLTVAPISGPDGPTGFVGVAEDVTERRFTEDALQRALEHERRAVERLNELDQQKNMFVASVSHELRTPMTSVLGFCHLLLDGPSGDGLSDRQRTLLGRVNRNARRLLSLIEDLLTVSRFDSEGVDLEAEDLDLVEVIDAAAEAVAEVRRGRRVLVRLPEQDGRAWHLQADRDQLERVVINLLSNAVKFTADGGSVTVSLDQAGPDALLIAIEDSGVGIPPEEQERVFERFFRASTARRAALPGTGLGLNIVRTIVEAHGGTVTVESVVGEGSRFQVTLPCRQPSSLRVVSS